jgi:predicted Rdx family selenoprotein
MAAWIAAELWTEFSGRIAIALTPVADGRLEIELDGALLFDRKAEDNVFPNLKRIREVKTSVRDRLPVAAPEGFTGR